MVYEIIACVALGIAVVNFVFNIILLRKVKGNSLKLKNQAAQNVQTDGIVFCRKCSSRYSATLHKCPVCGTLRK